jgi:hypothetical protein
MYHPAAALHQGSLRRVIEADFARLPEFLEKILAGETPASDQVPAHMRKNAPPASAPDAAPATKPTEAESQQMRLL